MTTGGMNGYGECQKTAAHRCLTTKQECISLLPIPSDQFSLGILRDIHHQNILHLEAILKPDESDKSSYVKICVEKYMESLYHCASRLKISLFRDFVMLQDLLRQVIEGLDELRLNGLYHGNLNIHSTYFDCTTLLVKLANFKEKGGHQGLLQAQIGDWHAAGIMFGEISTLLKSDPRADCYLLDELAHQLKNLPPAVMLHQIKDDVLDHVFFWSESRRRSFFIYGVQNALHDPYLNVDMIIKKECPRLCFELVKIVRELGYPV